MTDQWIGYGGAANGSILVAANAKMTAFTSGTGTYSTRVPSGSLNAIGSALINIFISGTLTKKLAVCSFIPGATVNTRSSTQITYASGPTYYSFNPPLLTSGGDVIGITGSASGTTKWFWRASGTAMPFSGTNRYAEGYLNGTWANSGTAFTASYGQSAVHTGSYFLSFYWPYAAGIVSGIETSNSRIQKYSTTTDTSNARIGQNIGDVLVGASGSGLNKNETYATLFSSSTAGSSIEMRWYGICTTGSLMLGIYNVSNGSPNTLLGSAFSTFTADSSASWHTLGVSGIALPIGSYYLAFCMSGA